MPIGELPVEGLELGLVRRLVIGQPCCVQARRLADADLVVAAMLQVFVEVAVFIVGEVDDRAVGHWIVEVKELLHFALLDANTADIVKDDRVALLTEPHRVLIEEVLDMKAARGLARLGFCCDQLDAKLLHGIEIAREVPSLRPAGEKVFQRYSQALKMTHV